MQSREILLARDALKEEEEGPLNLTSPTSTREGWGCWFGFVV